MAVHTRLIKREISDILSVYRIGNLLNFSGIQEGIENTNYKITTKRERQNPKKNYERKFESYGSWIQTSSTMDCR